MVIYNVTIKVEQSIVAEWLDWMKSTHIPELMETGLFDSFHLCRLLGQDDSEGPTYVVQYYTGSIERYQQYVSKYAAGLRKKTAEKFGDKFVSFQTVMQKEG